MNNKKYIYESHFERVTAHVKWYNPIKGYGFLIRENNPDDIMIHFSALDTVGCPYIQEGDQIICDIVASKLGLQVLRVIEVKFGSPEPRSLSSFIESHLKPLDPNELEDMKGTLKWYNPEKGYGFILPDSGGKEIFFHSSVMRASGYKFLEPGVRVQIKVSHSEKGPEAQILTVIYEEKTPKRNENI